MINSFKRRFARLSKWHPTSYPYLSGDTFRALAQHVLDMDSVIDTRKVKRNDIVFVQSSLVKEFFTKIHPKITEPYILITHNADKNITSEYTQFIDEKIIHWFAQNCLVEHQKLTPLPIGLENKWYYLHGIPKYFDILRKKKVDKKNRIIYKFNVATNPKIRGMALKSLEKIPFAETYTDWRESWFYLKTIQSSTFVASPEGNGADCIRTWEAMYLGAIPIVTTSHMTKYYSSLGLPLLVINDWSELEKMTPDSLTETYATIAQKSDSNALWADFWINEIKAKKI